MLGSKPRCLRFFQGPAMFCALRRLCRINFHLSWYLSGIVVTRYGSQPYARILKIVYRGRFPYFFRSRRKNCVFSTSNSYSTYVLPMYLIPEVYRSASRSKYQEISVLKGCASIRSRGHVVWKRGRRSW